MKEIIFSLLAACKEPDMDSGIPFKADAIIANPPAYGKLLYLMDHFCGFDLCMGFKIFEVFVIQFQFWSSNGGETYPYLDNKLESKKQ